LRIGKDFEEEEVEVIFGPSHVIEMGTNNVT
jgi:hypothetical protein